MFISVLSYIFATILVLCCAFMLCFIAYLHYIHKINAHIPGPPRSSFIWGNVPEILRHRAETGGTISEYVLEKRLEYGPIFVVFLLHRAIVFLGDPSYIRHVYVNNHKSLYKSSFVYHKLGFIYGERGMGYGVLTDTDELSWRKKRQLMNPAFHRKRLRDFMSNFNNVCDRFLARMDTVVDDGKPTSMVKEFAKVTLEAVSQVSFNIDTQAIEDPNSPFPSAIRLYTRGLQDNIQIHVSPTLLAIYQFKLFQNDVKREQINAARFLRKYASDCIMSRMKDIGDDKEVPNDLLSTLIRDGNLSIDEMVDEFITIFIAGQETTAHSLSFTLYEIIRNPDIEVKLLNEINEVLGERDNVEFEDLVKLKYLDQVLQEGLRRHPVAEAPLRFLSKDITVGGYNICKGTGVYSTIYLFSMNPEIWKDPEVFDPEGFSNVENMQNFSMAYFPFSIGPRNCIGQTFAKLETRVILVKTFTDISV